MAKRKKIVTAPATLPVYYAYYDNKTKQIFAVTNEKDDSCEFGVELTFDVYKNFVDGVWQFKDYIVDYIGSPPDATLDVISKVDKECSFKNNMFESILSYPADSTELIVTWHGPTKQWKFTISDSCKEHIRRTGINSKLLFFVTVEHDFDLLVRMIDFDLSSFLGYTEVCVPFITEAEHNIHAIAIATKAYFKSYGLIVNE
jgi:hypothetical protein